MRTFFLAPTRYGVGLTSVTLGLVRALDNLGLRVKFFKPIAQMHVNDPGPERSTKLVQRIMGHEPPTPITSNRAEDLLGDNKGDVLMEDIVALFQQASQDGDVVVVEGLVPTREMPYANRLNSTIAKSLNANIILVTEPGKDSLEELAGKLEITADSFGGIKNPNIVGYALNKLPPTWPQNSTKRGTSKACLSFPASHLYPLATFLLIPLWHHQELWKLPNTCKPKCSQKANWKNAG